MKVIPNAPLPGRPCTHCPNAFLCHCLLPDVVDPRAPGAFHLGQWEAFCLLAGPLFRGPLLHPAKIPKISAPGPDRAGRAGFLAAGVRVKEPGPGWGRREPGARGRRSGEGPRALLEAQMFSSWPRSAPRSAGPPVVCPGFRGRDYAAGEARPGRPRGGPGTRRSASFVDF